MNLIKRFNRYFDKIEESLNSPKEIEWIENDSESIGRFKVGEFDYRIEFIKQIGNNWSYSLSYFDKEGEVWSYNISQKGPGGFSVLSTIKSSLYYLNDLYKPNSIIFSAIDSSETRKRLYLNFCQEFCKSNKWKFSNRGTEDKKLFLMFNDDISDVEKEQTMKSVIKVIEIGK